MGETNYKPNSNRYKESVEEEKKEIKKVTSGTVRRSEEPLRRKFADTFLGESLDNVKSYLINDVLIPAVKDTFVELIDNGTRMLAYGSPSAKRRSSGSRTNYTNYSRISSKPEPIDRRRRDVRHGYDDIIFDNRADAMEVKDCLEEIMDKYKMVSIADFYELAGEQGSYTDRNYGWYEFHDIAITRDRDGYRLVLPKPTALD